MKNYEHYFNDVEVMKVAQNAASSFRESLSQDEIKSCILNAILRASRKYDKRNGAKFTSYLHNGVVLECLNQYKFNKKKTQNLDIHIQDKSTHMSDFETKDLIESVCDDPELVLDRFFGNMTVKELSKKMNVSGETIRIRLNKNLEKVRRELEKSV
jgi:DNA-directed RNA polymerase specialized sigma24 family protein